jgi:hypothetical protein
MQDELKQKINNIVNISESDFSKKFFKSEKIYNQLVNENISVWKIFFDPNTAELWVLDENSKRIDVRDDASKFINEIYGTLNQASINLETEKLNLSQYFNEAQKELRQKFASAETKETKEPPAQQTTKEDVYNNIVSEFGLDHLPEEDRDEIIIELSKTIQKQFLLDVYDKVGEENFKALEASVGMGQDFYNTTLKHVVPNYQEIFNKSREKVVTAFKKQ